MTDLEKVSLRVHGLLVELACGLGETGMPSRGKRLPDGEDGKGKEAAEQWLRTGDLPSRPEEMAALFPRLWFANMFLRNAVVRQRQAPEELGDPRQLPGILVLEVWEQAGRAAWEKGKEEFPWGD